MTNTDKVNCAAGLLKRAGLEEIIKYIGDRAPGATDRKDINVPASAVIGALPFGGIVNGIRTGVNTGNLLDALATMGAIWGGKRLGNIATLSTGIPLLGGLAGAGVGAGMAYGNNLTTDLSRNPIQSFHHERYE